MQRHIAKKVNITFHLFPLVNILSHWHLQSTQSLTLHKYRLEDLVAWQYYYEAFADI